MRVCVCKVCGVGARIEPNWWVMRAECVVANQVTMEVVASGGRQRVHSAQRSVTSAVVVVRVNMNQVR